MLFERLHQPFFNVLGQGVAIHASRELHCLFRFVEDHPTVRALRQMSFDRDAQIGIKLPVEEIAYVVEKRLAVNLSALFPW